MKLNKVFIFTILILPGVVLAENSVKFNCLSRDQGTPEFIGTEFHSATPEFSVIRYVRGSQPGQLIEKSRQTLLSSSQVCGQEIDFFTSCSFTQDDTDYGYFFEFTCDTGIIGSFFGRESDGISFECQVGASEPIKKSAYSCHRQ